ncbi:transglutaminase-like cysteine peptidase [Chelativorans sp. AA-79]|uniref:transglutaminase-like cysteine peptidase n=1 Tax=Chelativorans sp. AA-79 TaxID=3028735 RepID=UPI0023F88771|nr:transglutaminase-like cysteine peptidase [Chelativorans sp. AA-79]WEX07065.1 transglutaminase-like cysteine peptidase [Chelativorans sp. AA-79]
MRFNKGMSLLAALAILFASPTTKAFAAGDFMPTEGLTSQPVGHFELCQREPSECRQTSANPAPVELTRQLWALLVDVNNTVNTSVMPSTDREIWGIEEFWSYPDIYGDCEDYVLEKRRLLINAGVPASDLLITVVRQPNGDGHAVLTVTTDIGDFILDNMEASILPWSETSYQFLKRQSAHDASRWVSISDGRATAVGSVSSSR